MTNKAGKGSGIIWRWLLAGQFRTFPLRYIFAALSIAVGIALGFSVHIINASASDAFGDAVRNISGDADAQIAGANSRGFNEQLYAQIYALPEVADISPVIEMQALTGNAATRIKLIGIDPFRAAGITPLLLGRQDIGGEGESEGSGGGGVAGRTGGQAVFDLDAVYLSRTAMELTNSEVGRPIIIRANDQSHRFMVAGDLPGIAAGQVVAVTDIATAQWRYDRLGMLDRLDIKRADNISQSSLNRALSAAIPASARITGADNETRKRSSLSRAYRVNLEMLALVALVTGGFLVYSAQSLSAQTRQPQFALLRILGLQKTALQRQLLLEGLVLGVLGSILGLAMGYGLAYGVMRLVGADLGAGYFASASGPIYVSIAAIIVFLGFGIGTAILGSFAPSRYAAQLIPAQAIKASAALADNGKAPAWLPGMVLIITGAVLTLLPALNGLPVFGYIAIAAILGGTIWLTPWLATILLRPLTSFSGGNIAFDLGLRHVMRSPSQAAAALAGIVASIGLMIAMAIMVSSFRTSVDNWLESILSADLYASGSFAAASFDRGEQAQISDLPGIDNAEFSKNISISLDPQKLPVNLVIRRVDGSQYPLPLIAGGDAKGAGIPVWISEPASRLYNLDIGDRLRLPIAEKGAATYVAGIWSDYANQQGSIIMESDDYNRLTGDTDRTEIAISLLDEGKGAAAQNIDAQNMDAQIARLEPLINAIAGAPVRISNAVAIRTIALALFDRSFAITYGLQVVAILIGMAGVGATFAAQVGTRVKEFAMLRHIGLRKGQIIMMLGSEGVLLGIIGLVAGMASGLAISQVLIHVINPQSFNLTMKTHIPMALLLAISAALLVTSALTAILAGRRAAAKDILRAVKEDW